MHANSLHDLSIDLINTVNAFVTCSLLERMLVESSILHP